MKSQLRKILGIACAGLVALVLAVATLIYARAEWLMRRHYEAPLIAFEAPQDPAAVTEGERLARLRGCFGGCHGRELEGGLLFEEDWVGSVVAPDLTRVAATHSDSELERVIRRGVRKNGTTAWVMPSSMFYHLSDADLGAIIAFIRSRPPSDGPETLITLGPLGWVATATGEFPRVAEEIDPSAPRLPSEAGDEVAFGRYLAMTVCTECHGQDLSGSPAGDTPGLQIVRAYAREDFVRLMRDGIAVGERELGLMSRVARGRFRYFKETELHALHSYLQEFDGSPQ
jgi:cytochrome c553